MKNIFEKINKGWVIVIIVLILVIAVAVSFIIYNNSKKNGSSINLGTEIINNTSTGEEEPIKENASTEELKEKAPLMNMEDTDNVEFQNGEKINSSNNLRKDKEIEGLKITKISLHTEKGLSNFDATVENTTEEDFQGKIVKLIFKKNGEVIGEVEALIPTIKVNGTTTINVSTTKDIVNANDVVIEF